MDANAIASDEFKYTPDGARHYKKSTYLQNGVQRTEHTLYIGSYETTYYDTNSTIFQTEKTLLGDIFFVRKTPYVGSRSIPQANQIRVNIEIITGQAFIP